MIKDRRRKVKLSEAMKKAVKENDSDMAGNIADFCRFKLMWDYNKTFEQFNKYTGITKAAFDELLYESELYSLDLLN